MRTVRPLSAILAAALTLAPAASGDDPAEALPRGAAARLRHGDSVRALAFSPDGAALATAGDDSTVKVWGPRSAKESHTPLTHDGAVAALAFAADGRSLAALGGTLRL